MTRWILAALAAAAMIATAGCSDNTDSGVCAVDRDCEEGLVCDGTCVAIPCVSASDCLNGDQGCITPTAGGDRSCSVVECGCANCLTCPLGETCQNGRCEMPTGEGCSATNPCPDGQICDATQCRDCVGAECAVEDCTTKGCTGNQICNESTGLCEENTVTAEACDTCSTSDECGAGWRCNPLPTGSACTPPCASSNDCETGWTCNTGYCVPQSFRCEGCTIDGCTGGETCNTETGACAAPVAACGDCTSDWQCGAGSACQAGKCVARCEAGACSGGGTCETRNDGVQYCDGECSGGCTPACTGATPHCVAGGCVECRTADDCGGEACNGGVCGSTGECSGDTPYFWNGGCVECLNNDHCGTGGFCNQSTNSCTSDVCASCADPYPSCAEIGGDYYCVQCSSNDDCGVGGTCNLSTYACEGGTVTPTDPCLVDSDCDNGAQTGYTLKCHVATGLCYDIAGQCDGITAFCPGTDGQVRECKSILDSFGDLLGGGGGLPPELTGGSTIPGNCACSVGTCLEGVTCSKGLFASFLCIADPNPEMCFLNAILPPTNNDGLCGSQGF